MENTAKTCVLYNGACPICDAEIRHYRGYADQQNLPIRFDDLNSDSLKGWGLDEARAAQRLYVLQGDQLLSGVPAFLALWQQMPRYRWLAVVVGAPGVRQVATLLYDRIAAPFLYRRHVARQRRKGLGG